MFMFVGSRIRNRDVSGIGTGTCDIVTIQGRKIKFLLSKVDITRKPTERGIFSTFFVLLKMLEMRFKQHYVFA